MTGSLNSRRSDANQNHLTIDNPLKIKRSVVSGESMENILMGMNEAVAMERPAGREDEGGDFSAGLRHGSEEETCVVEAASLGIAADDPLRTEAAKVDRIGRYEPKLTENGISRDVLDKLLPGDEIIELDEPTVAGSLAYCFIKRAFDLVSCFLALIVLAIPMAVIAVKIKTESPGPAIYAQRRVGKDGEIFNVYKFRSMYVDAEAKGARWAQGDDPRITPFGQFMRKKRLDEIPQFWNVVTGKMSLIGPRPERPAFCEEFEKRIHGWHYRTKVRPGLSGLAQVTGGYDLLPKEKVVLDLEYIESRSVALDLKIVLKTLGVMKNGEGAR